MNVLMYEYDIKTTRELRQQIVIDVFNDGRERSMVVSSKFILNHICHSIECSFVILLFAS